MLNESELKFLEQRKKFNRFAGVVIPIFVVIIILFCIYSYLKTSSIINPYQVIEKIEENQLDITTMYILSILCPFFGLSLFSSLIAFFVFVYAWIKIEKRYLRIIEELRK